MNLQKYKFKTCLGLWPVYAMLTLFLLLSELAFTQILEDFNDGNFTESPEWTGNISQFIVSPDFMLQSNADSLSGSSNTAYLSTPGLLLSNTQWEFFVNPKLSTSSNNLMDIYLVSDVADLKNSVNGYFVRIGGTPDEVALFRKDGLTETKIINGLTGAIDGSSSNPTRVKVVRKSDGLWSLLADYQGTGTFLQPVGTVNDLTYSSAAFFGVLVRYSNSNRQKFFFDDLYIGPEQVDTIPPSVVDLNVISNQEIELIYSENVDPATAANTENFSVNNSIGEPQSASRNAIRFNVVNLVFGLPFPEGTTLTLSSSGIKDIAGNTQTATQQSFVFYRARANDVVINEIMADPDPPVQLPNVEYLELYNRTAYPINLGGWFIRAGTNAKVLPSVKILPDSFMVLTSFSGEVLYNNSIAVAGVVAIPSLTNTGAQVSLLDPSGTVISSVTYSDDWYGSTSKKEGGWSLEQISPLKPCAGASNWTASLHPTGGTPGKRNSVWLPDPDITLPKVDRVAVITPDTIRVFFSEPVLESDAINPAAYLISEGIGNPQLAIPEAPDYKSVKLVLAPALQVGLLYELRLVEPIKDCSGNASGEAFPTPFAIPSVCLPNDVVVNEILSDPKTGGNDYIEIYNRSQKIIDLGSLQLGSRDTITGELIDSKPIAPDGYLCFPGQYVLLTTSVVGVNQFYLVPENASIVLLGSMATYNNESGVVTLSRIADLVEIDQVVYRKEMHFSFLNSLDGVSLERVNYDRPSSDDTNWNSAASTVGYGTPGYKNSQFSLIIDKGAGELQISPEVFSPDSDGFDDILNIGFTFNSAGFTGTLAIYDANGRLVKYLARNMLFGTDGQLSWNGIDENQTKARIGIYIAYLEAFTLDGKTVAIKKPFVLGGKL
jgi:hypothetical protein